MQIEEHDIEKAISLCLNHPSVPDPSVKSQALAFCESLKITPSALKACIRLLLESRSCECKFFCLQVLEHQTKFQVSSRKTLLEIVKSCLLPNLHNWLGCLSGTSGIVVVPFYLKSKIAAVLALLVKHLYLQSQASSWNDAFQDIISFTFHQGNAELFLRFCIAFDEEVICLSMNRDAEEVCKNTAIKDEMRLRDVERLFRVWMMLLEKGMEDLQLADLVFKTLSLYLSWIDSQYLNDPLLLQSLRKAFIPGSSFAVVRSSATALLCTLICKGMPTESKVAFFRQNSIFELVQAIFPLFSTASNGEDQILLAKIITNFGLELCACLQESFDGQRAFVLEKVQAVFNLAVGLLEANIYTPSVNVVELTLELSPLFSDLIDLLKQMVKKRITPCPVLLETAKRILVIVLELVPYPEEYDFDNPNGDFEVSFQELKSILAVFLDNLYPILGEYYLTFTRQYITNALNFVSGSDSYNIQTAFWLIYRYAEVTKCLPAYVSKQTLPQELIQLISLMISNADFLLKSPQMNTETLFLFFEILLRYSQYGYFNAVADSGAEKLTKAVQFYAQALNQSHKFRERFAPSMAKFIKFQREKIIANQALCQSLASSLMPFLVISKQPLDHHQEDSSSQAAAAAESINCFYEIIGGILKGFPDQNIILDAITQSIYQESCREDNSKQANLHYLINSIMAIGSLCKGIPEAASDSNSAAVFQHQQQHLQCIIPTLCAFCEFSLQVLTQFHTFSSARKAVSFFMQRSSLVIGARILDFVGIYEREIIEFGELGELSESLSLLSSIIHRHENLILSPFSTFAKPLVERIFWFFAYFTPQGTDDEIGISSLKRSYLSWCCTLFTANCASLFAGDEAILSLFLRGITAMSADWSDSFVQRQAFHLMTLSVDLWMPLEAANQTNNNNNNNNNGIASFDSFVFQQFFPLACSTLASDKFIYSDGQFSLLLTEILSMFKAALRKQTANSLQVFKTLLQQMSVADEASTQELVIGMRDYEVKQLKSLVATVFANKMK